MNGFPTLKQLDSIFRISIFIHVLFGSPNSEKDKPGSVALTKSPGISLSHHNKLLPEFASGPIRVRSSVMRITCKKRSRRTAPRGDLALCIPQADRPWRMRQPFMSHTNDGVLRYPQVPDSGGDPKATLESTFCP